MMVSRRREYLADASGAELTRNPLALASALEKIDQAHGPTASVKRGTAHLCIADPLGRASSGCAQGWLPDLLASHPPMANRITALDRWGFRRNVQSHVAARGQTRRLGRERQPAQGAALLLLRVCIGIFMFFFGLDKASWLLDATPLDDAAGVVAGRGAAAEPVVPRAHHSGRAGVCAPGAARRDARRPCAGARVLDEDRRGRRRS